MESKSLLNNFYFQVPQQQLQHQSQQQFNQTPQKIQQQAKPVQQPKPLQQFSQQQQQQVIQQQQQFSQQQQQFSQQQQHQQIHQQPIQQQQQPVIKEENNGSTVEKMENLPTAGNDGEKTSSLFKKLFAGVRRKTTARVKKMRQNRRLRRILMPKNALMALHEIQGIKMSDFVINARTGGGFSAEVMVNNIQYEGSGPSKLSAKNSVCEKALRDMIISKMMLHPSKSASNENINESEDNKAEIEDDDVEMKDTDEDDDVPMINLASYALYKLFSEWESEGFEVPEFRNHAAPNNSSGSDKPKKPPTIRNDLPLNWETMHPTTLLCMMRPGISYAELGCEGFAPNQTQKMGVTVDGEHFIGVGRSKKLARRDAACLACNKLFGTNFQKED